MSLKIPKFQLYRMGSDPEFLFVKRADLDFIITPACTILGKDKAKTAASFIGCDNRPVIAEIRPSPSRNLKRHMYDLAYALHTAQQYIGSKHTGHDLLAIPTLHNETLGGHIHVSGFIDDPIWLEVRNYGYTWDPKHGLLPVHPGANMPDSRMREVVPMFQQGTIITPFIWGQIMNWLLEPFENWIMPWTQRQFRNKHYGGAKHPDVVRLGVSKAPFTTEKTSYVHWEYRLPSTWLVHPHLAYAYLALAKLTILNFRLFAEAWTDSKSGSKPEIDGDLPVPMGQNGEPLYNFTPMSEAANDKFMRAFADRVTALKRERLVITPDIADVFRAVEACAKARENWFARTTPINVEEWRRLL